MPGEAGGLGEHTVHDAPLFGAERREVPLRQVLLERDAGVLDGAPCCLERRPRLAQGLLRHVHQVHAARLERRAHAGTQRGHGCRVKLPRRLPDDAQPAVSSPASHGGRHVRPHDGHGAVVVGDLPALDTVEERGCRGGGNDAAGIEWVDPDLRVLDQLGPGDLAEVGTPQALLRDVRRPHGPCRHDRVRPAAHG